MGSRLVSAVEWWKKEGKWTCSLICYDKSFSQIWLEPGIKLSFKVLGDLQEIHQTVNNLLVVIQKRLGSKQEIGKTENMKIDCSFITRPIQENSKNIINDPCVRFRDDPRELEKREKAYLEYLEQQAKAGF